MIIKWILFILLELASATEENTLVLLHVLFRHGDRTPNPKEVYPQDPYINYTYPPYGFGQLTEAGKNREFSIGKSLKKTYDNFLENLEPKEVLATTTDYQRTKLSCQLVLSGLFSIKEDVNSNKSECYFQKKEEDDVLGDPGTFCPVFKELYNQQSTKLKGHELYENNKEFYDYILKNTGWSRKSPFVASELYYLLKSQDNFGLELPKWTSKIWPEDLSIRAADEYLVHTETVKMRRLATGHLLKKIIDDTEAITERTRQNIKILLYSGHDFNIAFLLILLEQFSPHIPPFGAYVTFEVHNINGVYGFKIFYEDYSTPHEKILFNLKDCGSFCPMDKFKNLMSKYYPISDECKIL